MCIFDSASGADGLIIEGHDYPEEAFSDEPQSFKPGEFKSCMHDIAKIAKAGGRNL